MKWAIKNHIRRQDVQEIYNHLVDRESLFGNTILLTGANGFLPSLLLDVLLQINNNLPLSDAINIFCLVRCANKFKTNLSARYGAEGIVDSVNVVECDLTNGLQNASDLMALPSIDFIIHAASHASPKYFGKNPVETALPNLVGTIDLLKLAQSKSTKKFLFFSTSEVYGVMPSDSIPTREDQFGALDPTNVRSCYAESKRMGETLCAAWYKQFNVPSVIVRPFHTYGPGMLLDDGRVFADFVADILENRDIVIRGDGLAKRAYCYVGDAVLGFLITLLSGTPGEAYNIGNPFEEVSVRELAELLVGMYPAKKLKVVRQTQPASSGYMPSAVARNCPDITKAKQLGWSPRMSITDGFRRTIDSYQ